MTPRRGSVPHITVPCGEHSAGCADLLSSAVEQRFLPVPGETASHLSESQLPAAAARHHAVSHPDSSPPAAAVWRAAVAPCPHCAARCPPCRGCADGCSLSQSLEAGI